LTGRRPNILIIHSHDLGQYLNCYGVKTVQTPNLDAFAGTGIRFENSFCVAPSCSPSRASLFTGRYPHSNGVMGLCHASFAWDLHESEIHLAEILGEAGYLTAAVGVVHETRSGPERCGYQRYDPASRAVEATDVAINILNNFQNDRNTPFFLSVGFIEPHRLPDPDSNPPNEHGFTPAYILPDQSAGIQVPGYLRDTPGTRQELAELQGAVRHVDEQFGRIVRELDRLNLADETLVIFTTDHGVAMPRAKCSLYDPGVEVALLMRFPRPGWYGGIIYRELISNIDILPSILDLLGLPIQNNVQGRSFTRLLDHQTYEPRQEIFTEMTYHDYYDPRRSIRTQGYKLIVNFSSAAFFMDPSQSWRPRSDTVSPANRAVSYHPDVELYDLQNDPWEIFDLSSNPETKGIKDDLLHRLCSFMVETEDPLLAGAVTSPQHERVINMLHEANKG
jgi:N-sulfoglucosamine sulfohydrolase